MFNIFYKIRYKSRACFLAVLLIFPMNSEKLAALSTVKGVVSLVGLVDHKYVNPAKMQQCVAQCTGI